jgi:hypothetical protein
MRPPDGECDTIVARGIGFSRPAASRPLGLENAYYYSGATLRHEWGPISFSIFDLINRKESMI